MQKGLRLADSGFEEAQARSSASPLPVLEAQRMPPEVAEELSLLADVIDAPSKPIVFASPRPRMGTSTAALAVAQSLTLNRCRSVLLVDCDYRTKGHPRLRALRAGAGLSERIAGKEDPGMWETGLGNLSYLPPGKAPDSPHRLFESEAFGRAMTRLAQVYEHVIIDAPPILPFSEILSLCRHGFPFVLVVDATTTHAGSVVEARTRITNAKGSVAGVIMNRRPYYIPKMFYRFL